MIRMSVTEKLVISALETAFDNKSDIYHVIRNPKYGAMAYDLFTPDLTFKTPEGDITVEPEEKTKIWKESVFVSKYFLKDKWTKYLAVDYYKSALLCCIAKNAKFNGWDFKVIVDENRTADDYISVQFYQKRYKKQIEEICKDKKLLKELCI